MTTRRRYLEDSYLDACTSRVADLAGEWMLLSETVAYPGGGGQPPDRAAIVVGGDSVPVTATRVDDAFDVWIQAGPPLRIDTGMVVQIDWSFRYALMRHHALMHIVNTVVSRAHGGRQTGTQLGPERSRIDFSIPGFDRTVLPELEAAVNEVIGRDLPIGSEVIDEAAFRSRSDLIRTRDVMPPLDDGGVRVVHIHGFESQVCGGTHVHSTGEIGTARIDGYDNKGRHNKRLYWTVDR